MSKKDKKKKVKKEDLFEEKKEKDEEETEDEETEEDEEETEEEEVVKETPKLKVPKEGAKFEVQQTAKGVFSVVSAKMEIVRSYDAKEVEDPEACANSYCEKMIKKSL